MNMQSHPIKVLLIDDDEDDYIVVRDLLSDFSSTEFILKWVSDYGAALDAILSSEFDICVLDYRTKERNGLELLREATEAGCDMPVIILTGQGDHGVDMEAIGSGAADYLVRAKLTGDMLKRSIRYSIARKKSERELKIYRNRLEDLVKKRTEQLETANEKLRVEIAERTQSEESLREGEERFRQLAENIKEVFWIANLDMTEIIYVSPAYEEIWGRTCAGLYANSRSWLDSVHPEDLGMLSDNLAKRGTGFQSSEYRIVRPDGSIRWIADRGFPVSDKTGEIYRFAGIAEDITERKKAEEALRASEAQLRQIIDLAPNMIFVKDWDGKYLLANEAVAKANNMSTHDLTGKYHADIHPYESELQNMLQADREVITKGETKFIPEVPFTDAQGNLRFLQITKVPFQTLGHKKPAVLGVAIDITERKRAEAALRESEVRLRRFIEHSPAPLAMFDREMRYLGASPRWLSEHNLGARDLIGLSHYEVFPEIPEYWRTVHRRGLEGVVVRADSDRFERADGSVQWRRWEVQPWLDHSGGVAGIVIFSEDITARKQAEQKVAQLAAIVQSSDDAIIGKNLDGIITSWNSGAEKIYGYAESEIIGKPISILLPHGREDEVQQILEKIKSGEHVKHYETLRRRKDNRNTWVSLTVSPVRNVEGEIVAASTIARDITESARQAREIKLLNRLYSVLSRVSQAVVRATSPEMFLEQACREVVEGGGFLQAWIGYVDSATNAVLPKAFWGRICQYLEGITVYADKCPEGGGPTGECIREAHPSVHNDFLHDPQTLPWRDRAAPFGIASSAAFPIERAGRIWGALTIYSDELGRFGSEDIKLLEKVAGDIGFALDNLDRELQRKRAEDALRGSETQLRQIIDLVPHMIFVKDWDGRYLLVNKAVADGYNTSVSALTGKRHADFRPDDSELQNMLQDDRKVIKSGETKFIPEESYTDAQGNQCFMQTTKVPFHIFGDKAAAVLGVAIDITDKKRAEEVLRENQSRLDLALRSAHMGVWSIDLIQNKRHFDDQVCHLLGLDPAKFTGTAEEFYKAVHPDDREMLTAALARSIEQDVLYEKEYRVVWPDGSVHCNITRGKLFRDEIGQPVRMNGLIWDITERKRAEKEKKELESKLRQSQKLEAIGTLAGGIAHDFNNILQPMMGYTEMALEELSPSHPVREDLEQVLNSSRRAKELVRQILAISRSTEEQQRIPIDISSIIKEALKLLRSSLPTSIEIRQNIRMGVALADPTQIHQVLMNLCTNAAHAMDDKGILEVGLAPVELSESDLADQHIIDLKPGPYLKLRVSDTGAGMDEATLERIFDPYFTTKEVGKGSGLGLAVVHGIVKRHEGAITVRSEPGKGTTFSVYIPRVDVQAEATMQVDDLPPRGSERLLLVDDEPAVIKMGTRFLKHLGYRVTSQTDSVNALEIFRSSPDEFDLVITDYTMPKLTGLDFAREARQIRPAMPVLLCTGFSEKITPDSVKELGMELLMKPYGMREISEVVRKILDARKDG